MKSLSPEALETFVQRTVAGLPEELTLRKTDLQVLLELLPESYPRRQEIAIMVEHLIAHELAQVEFAFTDKRNGGKS